MRIMSIGVLVLAACAARQQTGPAAPPGWSAEQVAEMRGRCFAGWTDRGVEVRNAKAICRCMVPQVTERFSYQWFDNGQPLTPEETDTISQIQDRCIKQVASRDVSENTAGSGGAAGTEE